MDKCTVYYERAYCGLYYPSNGGMDARDLGIPTGVIIRRLPFDYGTSPNYFYYLPKLVQLARYSPNCEGCPFQKGIEIIHHSSLLDTLLRLLARQLGDPTPNERGKCYGLLPTELGQEPILVVTPSNSQF